MKVFNSLLLLIAVIIISNCGNRKSPTGGKIDKEKPVVVSVIPEQYSNIIDGNIEITFSKPIDRTSVYEGERGVSFYPLISQKRFNWSDNTLTIEIGEQLIENRNYYLTLSEQIRDLRGNSLDQKYLFVFHSGKLVNNRIFGEINYEKEEDLGSPVQLTLLSADSLRIFSQEIQGQNYTLENLDNESYQLRAFIDKNSNNRFDLGDEPYFETVFRAEKSREIAINLEYFDESKPEILSLRSDYQHLLSVSFNKPVKAIAEISISTLDTLLTEPEIIDYDIMEDRLEVITSPLDSLNYVLTLYSIEDHKNNVANVLSKEFLGSNLNDTAKPEIVTTLPRSGAVVEDLLPALIISFNKYMNLDSISIQMTDTISGSEIALTKQALNSRQIKITPRDKLTDRTPYRLVVSQNSKDMAGNYLEEDYILQFLPISVVPE
jgi:hypothetical protein